MPVYNCRVWLCGAEGTFVARAAELADIEAEGRSQREALQKIVALFKETIARHRAADEPIPWLVVPHSGEEGEREFWVAVHL